MTIKTSSRLQILERLKYLHANDSPFYLNATIDYYVLEIVESSNSMHLDSITIKITPYENTPFFGAVRKMYETAPTREVLILADELINKVDRAAFIDSTINGAIMVSLQWFIDNNVTFKPIGMHIDDWLDNPFVKDENVAYAKFVLDYFRMPAWKQNEYRQFMSDNKLFCAYDGKTYRCTGASRMGDIWLAENYQQDIGYNLRVNVTSCTHWHNNPEAVENALLAQTTEN